MISKQETCHLILSIPIVSCSYNFVTINITNETNCIDVVEPTNTENGIENDSTEQATIVKLKTLIYMYRIILVGRNWLNEELFCYFCPSLHDISLHIFCKKFMVGQRVTRRNKICKYLKSSFVAVFFWNIPAIPRDTTTSTTVNPLFLLYFYVIYFTRLRRPEISINH